MQVLCNRDKIDQMLSGLTEQIVAACPADKLALVGIRSRGEILAQRLQRRLEKQLDRSIPVGVLDITLYRDDLNQMTDRHPVVRSTEISFNVDDLVIVLVDDVLNTGRSTRAALDALMDLGRPQLVRLAVLIDRGHRELPIAADYVGQVVDSAVDQRVSVFLEETDDKDEVVIQ